MLSELVWTTLEVSLLCVLKHWGTQTEGKCFMQTIMSQIKRRKQTLLEKIPSFPDFYVLYFMSLFKVWPMECILGLYTFQALASFLFYEVMNCSLVNSSAINLLPASIQGFLCWGPFHRTSNDHIFKKEYWVIDTDRQVHSTFEQKAKVSWFQYTIGICKGVCLHWLHHNILFKKHKEAYKPCLTAVQT